MRDRGEDLPAYVSFQSHFEDSAHAGRPVFVALFYLDSESTNYLFAHQLVDVVPDRRSGEPHQMADFCNRPPRVLAQQLKDHFIRRA